jgi:hypothetical protein
MARIVRPDSPARARTSLVAAVRAALADLDTVREPADVRDRLAYAGLALRELERSTERTAEAWERRGYWVKVDQFRREWSWAGQGAAQILEPLLRGDLEGALDGAAASRLRLPEAAGVDAPKASGIRWAGAFARLTSDPQACTCGRRAE